MKEIEKKINEYSRLSFIHKLEQFETGISFNNSLIHRTYIGPYSNENIYQCLEDAFNEFIRYYSKSSSSDSFYAIYIWEEEYDRNFADELIQEKITFSTIKEDFYKTIIEALDKARNVVLERKVLLERINILIHFYNFHDDGKILAWVTEFNYYIDEPL